MKKYLLFIALFFSLKASAQYTPTPNIGLQIPANGSNNWNVPLNFNFNLLDQLLGGTAYIPALKITNNLTVGGTVTAGGFVGAGGTGFALTPGATQYSASFFSASGTASTVSGILLNGISVFSPSTPPRAAISSDITNLFGTLTTGCYLSGAGTCTVPSSYTPPTGTGFVHVTGGAQDSAARALVSADIPNNAANTSGTAASLSAASALPNGTTATTQAPGDNTTNVATDAFVLANAGATPCTSTMGAGQYNNSGAFGCTAPVTVISYSQLLAAIAAAGSNPTTIQIPVGITLAANLSIPANVVPLFQSGGEILGAYTLTFNGSNPIASASQKIFGSTLTVVGLTLRDVPAQWFGDVPDGTTDNTAALQACLASLSSGALCQVPLGWSNTSTVLNIVNNGTGFDGVNNFLWYPGYPVPSAIRSTSTSAIIVHASGITNPVVRNVTLTRSVAGGSGSFGLDFDSSLNLTDENVGAYESNYNFRFGPSSGSSKVGVDHLFCGQTLSGPNSANDYCLYFDSQTGGGSSSLWVDDVYGYAANGVNHSGTQIADVHLKHAEFSSPGIGVLIDCATGGTCGDAQDIDYEDIVIDSYGTYGYKITNVPSGIGTGAGGIHIDGGWVAGDATANVCGLYTNNVQGLQANLPYMATNQAANVCTTATTNSSIKWYDALHVTNAFSVNSTTNSTFDMTLANNTGAPMTLGNVANSSTGNVFKGVAGPNFNFATFDSGSLANTWEVANVQPNVFLTGAGGFMMLPANTAIGGVQVCSASNGYCPTGLSGMTAGRVPIATTATTATTSKAIAGSGAGLTSGPTTTTANDCAKFADAAGTLADAGSPCGSGSSFNPASPGPIGGTTPGAGTFTTLNAQGDTSSTPSLFDYVTSTNAAGTITSPASHQLSTAGIAAGYACSIIRTFISGSVYNGFATCNNKDSGYAISQLYTSNNHALGSEAWVLAMNASPSTTQYTGAVTAPSFNGVSLTNTGDGTQSLYNDGNYKPTPAVVSTTTFTGATGPQTGSPFTIASAGLYELEFGCRVTTPSTTGTALQFYWNMTTPSVSETNTQVGNIQMGQGAGQCSNNSSYPSVISVLFAAGDQVYCKSINQSTATTDGVYSATCKIVKLP